MKDSNFSKEAGFAASQNIKERDYWLNKLSGHLEKTSLSYKYEKSDPDIHEPRHHHLEFGFTREVSDKLIKISNGSDYRLHIIMVAIWNLLLYKYTQHKDILVGTSIYKQDVEGELINTVLALRNQIHDDMTGKNFLLQMAQTVFEANENQNYPIETLLYKLNLPFSGEDFPLFDTAVLLENIHDKTYLQRIKLEILITFTREDDCLKGRLEFNRLAYEKEFIERLITHLSNLTRQLVLDPDIPIKEIEVLTPAEKKQIISEFNANTVDFPGNATIFHYIRKHARSTPDNIALVYQDQQVKYRQLDEKSNRLAERLIQLGVRQDTTVGILLDRSPLMAQCILAVWKAGGAYIPIDTDDPVRRTVEIMNDSRARVILTQTPHAAPALEKYYKGTIIYLDNETITRDGSSINPRPGINMNSLAYIIYTSGSAGKPKGAMVEHVGMMNHIRAKINLLQITGNSILAQNATHTFDISVWQFFAALTAGGKTVIYPHELILEPDQFITQLQKDQITILQVVPSYLSIMLDIMAERPALPLPFEYLVVTGETLKPQLVKKWFAKYPGIKMVNAYGPTEASDDITHYIMDKTINRERIPIGIPVQNLNIYIVDENMKLCPIGVKGEICVSGIGVGRGYLNNPGLTSGKFNRDLWDYRDYYDDRDKNRSYRSYKSYISKKLYRTGDIGCWLPNGTIEFFGRKDHQVKIRGFRIELGEIESQLLKIAGIKEAVIVDKEEGDTGKCLCAYFVTRGELSIPEIKESLAAHLPDYMMPDHFVPLDRIPLTTNGKINRKALPAPGIGIQYLPYITVEMLAKITPPAESKAKPLEVTTTDHIQDKPLCKEEKEQLVYAFNATAREYPHNKPYYRLFQEQAEQAPGKVVYVFEDQKITSSQLNERSHRLASLLRLKGVNPGTIVGLLIRRSIEMMTAVLAINIARGAYLPIDSHYPPHRVKYMLADSQVPIMLTNVDNPPSYPCTTIDLNDKANYGNEPRHPVPEAGPSDLAYVIYTSGTTGKPKGVMVEHRPIVNFSFSMIDILGLREDDKMLSLSTLAFDMVGTELFPPLIKGLTVVIGNIEEQSYSNATVYLIQREKITIFQVTPSSLQLLLSDKEHVNCLNSVRLLLVGAEKFPETLLDELRTLYPRTIFNLYGPTETTTWSTAKDVTTARLDVGKPIANTQAYILGEKGRIQPIGSPGELCIGGDGVARGYLNNPTLTHQKFIVNTFKQPGRIYKTGDYARWTNDGNIDFAGRTDYQVQISGFRVELGEIESVLLKHEHIKQAAVILKESETNEKSLHAYVVSGKKLTRQDLNEYLSGQLPLFMFPTRIARLEKMPLTPNGKINRRVLAALEIDENTTSTYMAPRGQVEEELTRIWAEVLGVEKNIIGIDANFFQLGGHSLKAIKLTTKIHKKFNVKLPLAEIFKTPTTRGVARYIKNVGKIKYTGIEPVEKKEYYPLSSAQQRLYIIQCMDLESTAYNMPQIIPLSPEVNREKLEETFKQLINRHESLRTSFIMIDEEPVQQIHDQVEFEIEYDQSLVNGHWSLVNCQGRGEVSSPIKVEEGDTEGTRGLAPLPEEPAARSSQPATRTIKNLIRPFDLTRAPLLRVRLTKSADNRHILLLDMHHIISDGVSHEILVEDFMAIYDGKYLPRLRLQYKDFARWQDKEKEKEELRRQERFWLNEFEQEIPVLNLPTDFPRPAVQSFEGSTEKFEISADDTSILKSMALEQKATLYMLLLAVFTILLAKLSGQEDIIIGTPVAGRRHADLEKIIGMFVNTLVLRNLPIEEKNFREFFIEVKQKALQSFENQDYQFEDLVEKITVNRDVSRNPLFDVMYSLQSVNKNTGINPPEQIPIERKKYLEQEQYGYQSVVSKFDMTFNGREAGGRMVFTVGYCTKLFKKETIIRFIKYFKNIISSILDEPEKQLLKIDIITSKEKHQVLYEFNTTTTHYPQNKTIDQLFVEQAASTPDNIALAVPLQVKYRTHMTYISYRELNTQSDPTAGLLSERGVQPDNIVAIMAERSPEMIIGILGVLKSGGAYLPIDPEYPQQRIDYILKDSGAKILLTGQEIADSSSFGTWNSDFGISPRQGGQLAYVIYTSGTTGKPKGTLITHRNFVSLLFNDKFQFDFNGSDTWTLFHSYCFDFSVWEMYGALLYGGKLRLIHRMTAVDTQEFLGILAKENITVLNQTPSAFYNLVDLEVQNPNKHLYLKYVIFGGEALNPQKLHQWKNKYPETRLINMFGITETTVHVTYKKIEDRDMRSNISNIGRPIPTLSTYIMGRGLQLLPPGFTGEICIVGEGLGRGYLNRPQLTSEKFVNHPDIPGQRLYRSGDLGRILENGDMEYLGRIDLQVKIRGFRIELGEIENQLLKKQNIKEALVLAKEKDGEKYLCAYIVSKQEINVPALRRYLASQLPDYMIPSSIKQIEKIPLTPHGKVDRNALPAITPGTGGEHTPPRNTIERSLAQLWSEVLVINETIGIDDNFFELGGHSLNAAVLIAKIHKALDVKVPLIEIFKRQTIKSLAEYIGNAVKDRYFRIEPAEKKEYYPLSSAQKRCYFIQQMYLNSTGYNMPMVLSLGKDMESNKLESTIKKLVACHESLRTSFAVVKGAPVQQVHKADDINFTLDYYQADSAQAQKIVNTYIKPFDLTQAPLIRSGLIKLPDGSNVWIADLHHIISDGTSQTVLAENFLSLYKGFPPEPLRIQYKDFSQWQDHLFASGGVKPQEDYWLTLFADSKDIPRLNLPTDYNRPNVFTFEGGHYTFKLEKEDARNFKTLGAKSGATLYMNMLALLNALFYKYTGQQDIIIGTGIAGRPHADLQSIIGMFVNMLAMRNYPIGEKQYESFLEEVIANSIKAFENQDIQFETLVEKLELERDTSRNPLFDVLLVVQNFRQMGEDTSNRRSDHHEETLPAAAGTRQYLSYEKITSKFDMTFFVSHQGDDIVVSIQYYSRILKEDSIKRLASQLKQVIKTVTKKPATRLKDISILCENQKKLVLETFNDTANDYPVDKTIHRLFVEQAAKTPDNIAVIVPLEVKHKTHRTYMTYITYRELDKQSNRTAGQLNKKGVQPDNIVAIMVERSVEMIIGILGILKAGGAYLPIDPAYPQERIDFMLKDSNVKILLTMQEIAGLSSPAAFGIWNLEFGISPGQGGQMAYVIYTSGSTGRPKGVSVEHPSLVNLCCWHNRYFDVKESDHATQYASISFDASVWEIFPYLIKGAALYIIGENIKLDIEKLDVYFQIHNITISFLPTQLCEAYIRMEKDNPSLRVLLTGGDKLQAVTPKKYHLYNNYGPTENTVVTTSFHVRQIYDNIPIGKPINNNRVYILHKHSTEPTPVGVPGELCISGDSLARGYLNQPELTAEKFCLRQPGGRFLKKLPPWTPRKNFLLKVPGKKSYMSYRSYMSYILYKFYIYRTGDLARWLPDGNIEFLDRIDNQVKIRGFRIELGEVESQLKEIKEIKQAVVIERKKKSTEKYLCAYFTAKKPIDSTEIRKILGKRLPAYMVPSHFIPVEQISLTPNGKVDQQALFAVEISHTPNYIAPQGKIEKMIAETWKEVLDIDKVGVNDNFFEVGGTSLDVIQVTTRIKEALNRDIPIVIIFQYPTISALAGYLEEEKENGFVGDNRSKAVERGKRDRIRRLQKKRGNK